MSFIDEVIKRVRDADAARPRSTQAAVGWSEAGGCRAYLGYRIDEAWPSEEPDNWAAIRGTAIHAHLDEILGGPGVLTEVTTSYRGIPGHADLVRTEAAECWDFKGLALTTPIPTPSGWTTMGAVRVGDAVIGSDGRPCRVTAKSAVKQIGTYVVRFKDGPQVVCDREHLWWVKRGNGCQGPMEVVGIEEMAARVRRPNGQPNWRIPVAEPLELPDAGLPVPPYVLGCWLGDGSLGCGRITGAQDIFAEIEREGFTVGGIPPSQRGKAAPFRTVYALRGLLADAGVLNDRHVPPVYLRASVQQRQALIQGLMDSDGGWNRARNRAQFLTTSKVLAEAMFELLVSVGEKPHMAWASHSGFGVTCEACHIEWTPTRFNPFRLAVKADRVDVSGPLKVTRARWRTISTIEPGPDVATACIAVDSANSTYLCGEAMIPTHNTTRLANSQLWRSSPSALRQKRIQVHGYAAGLVDAGTLPEDCTVGLLVIPVDGSFADWWAYEEPFDRSLADEGADRLDWVRERMAAGAPLPKDQPYAWCESWCEFFSLCRGADDPKALNEITDPQAAAAVARYGELNAQIKPLAKEKENLGPLVRGLRGTAGDWRVSTSEAGEPKTVLDEDWIRADYASRGEPVPEIEKPGASPRLTVTKIKRKDAAA